MISISSLLKLAHLVGLALALGAATVKLVLVLRAKRDAELVPALLAVRRPVTKCLVTGMILATVSGVVWLVQGYGWSAPVVAKVAVVVALWVLGPVIDNVVEPRLVSTAPRAGEPPSPAFLDAQRTHLVIEAAATLLMYAAVVIGASL